MRNKTILLAALGLLSGCATPVGDHHPEWKAYFDRYHAQGCITVYDASAAVFIDYNADRCVQRFAPNHTLVLPCALMAMQSGLAADTTALLPVEQAPTSLAQFVRTCEPRSVDELARLLRQQPLQRYLQRIGYGNQQFHFNSDDPLRPRRTAISADEQVRFLKKLRTGALRTSPEQLYQLIGLMRQPADSSTKLYALASPADTITTGWYIGWIEKENRAWYFALNYEFLPHAPAWPVDAGRNITHAILRELKLLP
ncbi:MAG: hypothetical protein NZL95_01595 [Chitinophagales bacterium]|nr:hypothetical protein [Chitinophagales bacterium]MDW8427229.1 hypothetical protein [Chitinophagales bacterium]